MIAPTRTVIAIALRKKEPTVKNMSTGKVRLRSGYSPAERILAKDDGARRFKSEK